MPLAAHTVGAARELAFGVRTLEEDLPPGSGKNKRLKISAATALCRISQQEAIWR